MNAQTIQATKTQRQSGFTLLELLVAFAIMAISLGMLYRASGGAANSVANIELREKAVTLARSLLDLNDSVPSDGFNMSGDADGLQWRLHTEPFLTQLDSGTPVTLHQVKVEVSWADGSNRRLISVQTLLPQQAAEIKK